MAWLHGEEHDLFFSQSHFDQRHGFESALYVAAHGPGRTDLIRAALLHDLGKRRARIGSLGRSLASAWSKFGGKTSGPWAAYLEHGRLGSEDLEGAGSEPLVVLFARSHHGDRPDEIPAEDWDLLQRADKVRRRESADGRRQR